MREQIPDADKRVVLIEALGFGYANVVVAVPQAWIDVRTMADLDDVATAFRHTHGRKMRVATKYINLTRDFFSQHGVIDYRIVESSGATEGAPAAGTRRDDRRHHHHRRDARRQWAEDRRGRRRSCARRRTWWPRAAPTGAPSERELARVILDRIAAQARARAFREVRARFAGCDAKLVDDGARKSSASRRRSAARPPRAC